MGRPSKYPEEFRRNAVELVRTSGRSIADVARSLGITDTAHASPPELIASSSVTGSVTGRPDTSAGRVSLRAYRSDTHGHP